jgi:hypothetical protein
MGDFLARLNGGEIIGFAAVAGGLLTGVILGIVAMWRSVRITEVEAALKQQMLEKGMSAAEIEQVLRASSERDEKPAEVPFTGQAAMDKPRLVKAMAENSFSGEDIERVLRAMHPHPGPERGGADGDARSAEKVAVVANLLMNDMAVDDIERVLRAFSGPGAAALTAGDQAALVNEMLSHSLSAGDIERVLRALQPAGVPQALFHDSPLRKA